MENTGGFNFLSSFCIGFAFSLIGVLIHGFSMSLTTNKMTVPLIGDFSDHPPATDTFTFMLTFTAIFWMLVSTIRYLQLRALIRHNIFHDMTTRYYFNSELPPNVDRNFLLVNPHISHYWVIFNELNGYCYTLAYVIGGAFIGYGVFGLAEAPFYHNLSFSVLTLCTIVYCSMDLYISQVTSSRLSSDNRHSFRALAVIAMFFSFFIACASICSLTGRLGYVYFQFKYRHNLGFDNAGFSSHFFLAFSQYAFILAFAAYVFVLAFDFRFLKFSALQTSYYYTEAEEERKAKRRRIDQSRKSSGVSDSPTPTQDLTNLEVKSIANFNVSPTGNQNSTSPEGAPKRRLLMKSRILSKTDLNENVDRKALKEDRKVTPNSPNPLSSSLREALSSNTTSGASSKGPGQKDKTSSVP